MEISEAWGPCTNRVPIETGKNGQGSDHTGLLSVAGNFISRWGRGISN